LALAPPRSVPSHPEQSEIALYAGAVPAPRFAGPHHRRIGPMEPATHAILGCALSLGLPLLIAIRELVLLRAIREGGSGQRRMPEPPPAPPLAPTGQDRPAPAKPLPDCLVPRPLAFVPEPHFLAPPADTAPARREVEPA
jgi:hypothetical protein